MSESRATISPICEEDAVHQEVIDALAPSVRSIRGAGELLAALSDDTRLKILFALSRAELCVCDVAAVADVSKAVASYHLRLLYRMGLADYRRDGRMVYYSLGSHDIIPVVEAALQYAFSHATPNALPTESGVESA